MMIQSNPPIGLTSRLICDDDNNNNHNVNNNVNHNVSTSSVIVHEHQVQPRFRLFDPRWVTIEKEEME